MDLLKKIITPYIDAQNLLVLLSDYKKPREVILRMVKNKKLIRLKNGFFLIADNIFQKPLPYEQIANMLYGPSYVSLEWALSFYGMIPEKVQLVTSMTLGKAKNFQTPIGDFSYHTLNAQVYPLGVEKKKAVDFVGDFLMASPEKALCDFVFLHLKKLTKEELRVELIESSRLNVEALQHLRKDLLHEIAKAFRSKAVHYLSDLIGVL